MKTRCFVFLLILGMFAGCQSDTKQADATTTSAATPKADPAQPLLDFVKANPDKHEENSKKLNEAATLYLEDKKYQAAFSCLGQAVRNHYTGSMTVENALMMAEIYRDRYNKENLSQIVHQCLSEAFPDDPKVVAALKQHPVTIPPFGDYLDGLAKELTDPETGKLKVPVANDYVAASELHAMLLPDDAENAVHLHKAGEIARTIRVFPKAIELYQWIYERYPDSPKASQALFMMAFTYDDELKQHDKAKGLYETYIEKYPDKDFAESAKFLLENLGKTNEEIIEGFGKKQ